MSLTPKQKAFADFYIMLGNATEAARKAGYNERSARQIGAENLTKPSVSAYISERMTKQEAQRVASADEVLKFYTSVMRGEVKDQFGLDSSLNDRLKAADSLMKRHAVSDDRARSTMAKLDSLLREFEDAVRESADQETD